MKIKTLSPWPPKYTLKHDARSRHVRFKISVAHGLEVVVPLQFNVKNLGKLLTEKRPWIEKHLGDAEQQQADISHALAQTPLPKQLMLTAINETWDLDYIHSDRSSKVYMRPDQTLAILAPLNEHTKIYQLLIHWLKRHAKRSFEHQLKQLSEHMGCHYQKLIIRAQKTRWGSCNSQKTISLNYKLLFLPAGLSKHVMLHELCHTVHLNHSDKFWQMVAKFEPDYQANRLALRSADQYLPSFIRITAGRFIHAHD